MQIKDISAAVFIQQEQQGDHISLTGQKAVNIKGKFYLSNQNEQVSLKEVYCKTVLFTL